jgi:hypothetical protein
MYFYTQQRSFCNRYKVAWPCQHEPSSIQNLLTAAVCSVRKIRYKVIWIYSVFISNFWKLLWMPFSKIGRKYRETITSCSVTKSLVTFPSQCSRYWWRTKLQPLIQTAYFFGNCSVLLVALSNILDGTQRSKLCVCRRN